MPNPRKQIILNEILFWKQNKLLPEQYCNFLMTLYSEGNEIEDEEALSHKKAVKAKEKRKNLMMMTMVSIIAILLFISLLLVTKFVLAVLIAVSIVTLILMVTAFKLAKKNDLLSPLLQVASALLIFGLSVKVSLTYFESNLIILFGLLLVNCIMWLITGLKLKQMYFTLSGVLGLVVLIGYQLFRNFF